MLILAVRHGSRSRAAKHITIQVKYTNPSGSKGLTIVLFSRYGADDLGNAGTRGKSGKCDAFGPDEREVVTSFFPPAASLSSSGSNQAREGRLVDALAARGDEGRDTLR